MKKRPDESISTGRVWVSVYVLHVGSVSPNERQTVMKQEKGAFAAVEIPVEMLEAIVKDARICRDAFELAAASYDGAMAERAQEKYEALCLVCGVIGLPVPSMAA